MKKFRVTVNGISYDVEVEEIKSEGGSAAAAPSLISPATASKPVSPAAVPAPPAQAVPQAAPVPASGGSGIKAPMPGNILKVLVEPGQSVSKGTVLVILEAMKMENEIMAPADGVVVSVHVKAGQAVASGELLVTFQG